jgi:flagellar biosynthesis/type III secretory pathway M-ring protein FliF/YscJ
MCNIKNKGFCRSVEKRNIFFFFNVLRVFLSFSHNDFPSFRLTHNFRGREEKEEEEKEEGKREEEEKEEEEEEEEEKEEEEKEEEEKEEEEEEKEEEEE